MSLYEKNAAAAHSIVEGSRTLSFYLNRAIHLLKRDSVTSVMRMGYVKVYRYLILEPSGIDVDAVSSGMSRPVAVSYQEK